MSEVKTKKESLNGHAEISLEQIKRAIPKRLFVKSELRFLLSVAQALTLTLSAYYLGKQFIPLSIYALPLWIVYAFVTGTIATGLWVLGHECGHQAFSDSKILNDTLGFIIHTALLVPYFSWQWSHHVHHSKCNHMEEGETHVPGKVGEPMPTFMNKIKEIIGVESFSLFQFFNITVIGWPLYLLIGVTGGPKRGFTSHFIIPNKLFPKDKLLLVSISNIGIIIMLGLIYKWIQATSFWHVMALFGGPYLVVNGYLTMITYLQHTEREVPHYDSSSWNWLKGALSTVDRNYPPIIDGLQYHIGTTHVVHHIFHELPHYHAVEANVYLKQILGDLYYQDSKTIIEAIKDTCQLVCVEHKGNGVYKYM